MIDIRISVRCPDLVQAAGTLAAALGAKQPPAEPPKPPQIAPKPEVAQTPTPAPTAQPVPTVTHQVTTGTPLPDNIVTISTASPPQTGSFVTAQAPVTAPTTAPSYTVQDLARAGAALLRDKPNIQPQLMGLLAQFGVQAATELKPEQLSPFADALRALGAKI